MFIRLIGRALAMRIRGPLPSRLIHRSTSRPRATPLRLEPRHDRDRALSILARLISNERTRTFHLRCWRSILWSGCDRVGIAAGANRHPAQALPSAWPSCLQPYGVRSGNGAGFACMQLGKGPHQAASAGPSSVVRCGRRALRAARHTCPSLRENPSSCGCRHLRWSSGGRRPCSASCLRPRPRTSVWR